jgi:hypothetical protein
MEGMYDGLKKVEACKEYSDYMHIFFVYVAPSAIFFIAAPQLS